MDNLQFLGGYYPYDFESRIKLYGVNRDMTESYKHGFLDLVSGNPPPDDQPYQPRQSGG